MEKLLAVGGLGLLGYYFWSRGQANPVNTGQAPAVGTKQVTDPNPNTGGLSGYPVGTDQMGNVIYGDNGPRPTDFVNSGNTSDVPAAPLSRFRARPIPPGSNPNIKLSPLLSAQQIADFKAGMGAHARGTGPYPGPFVNPASLINSGGFVSDQAYFDAAYILRQGAAIQQIIYKGAPSAPAINGADEGASIQGHANPYGSAYGLDFTQHPPSASVYNAVVAARKWNGDAYIPSQRSQYYFVTGLVGGGH
jgi:hypothetical protein